MWDLPTCVLWGRGTWRVGEGTRVSSNADDWRERSPRAGEERSLENRERKRDNPKSTTFVSQRLQGETVMSSLCNKQWRVHVFTRLNERSIWSVQFTLQVCFALYVDVILHICFEEHLNTAWNEGRNPCYIDWQEHLFILLMRPIFLCIDRSSIGGNYHLLILPT